MERKIFEKDVNGKKVRCEVIATYEDSQSGKKYLVYTDGITKDLENVKFIYSLYELEGEGIRLLPIETLLDIKIGEELVKEVLKDM